jgi:hypothetical protein
VVIKIRDSESSEDSKNSECLKTFGSYLRLLSLLSLLYTRSGSALASGTSSLGSLLSLTFASSLYVNLLSLTLLETLSDSSAASVEDYLD